MACEWTHHVSYKPGLIAICVNPRHATYDNIIETGEFGVCITAKEQDMLASVSGRGSGRDFNKIKILEELGYSFTKAEHIDVFLVNDSAVKFECKVKETHALGDHTMFVGEVLAASSENQEHPLVFHQGKYWILETRAEKPSDEFREKISALYTKHGKQK